MRVAGLVVSLALLGFGLFFLVADFVRLGFRWREWLVLAVVAAVVYAVVWVVGGSLSRELDGLVSRFTSGQEQELTFPTRYVRVLALLLVVLLPFLVYLLLFALHSAMALTLLAMPLVLQSSARLKGPLIVGLVIVVVGTFVAIVLGFYNLFFARLGKSFGIPLQEAQHPRLWRLARETASAAGARVVDDVVLSPFTGIGVYLAGNLLAAIFGRGRQVLMIGVPSVYGMSVGELQAILAHEYAHFSHHDTQWGRFRVAMEVALMRAFEATPGPRQTGSGILSKLRGTGGDLVRLIVWLNPAFWILRVYVDLFFRTTGGFRRVREVMADALAARLYGGKTLSDALLRTVVDDRFFGDVVQPRLVEAMRQGKAVARLTTTIDAFYGQIDEAEHSRVREALAGSTGPVSPSDSHPADAVRVAYLRRFADKPDTDSEPVEKLFGSWEQLDAQAAEMFNARLAVYVQSLPPEQRAGSAQGA